MLIHVLLYSFRSDDIDDMAFEEIEFGLEFDINTVDEEDVDESHKIPGVIKYQQTVSVMNYHLTHYVCHFYHN